MGTRRARSCNRMMALMIVTVILNILPTQADKQDSGGEQGSNALCDPVCHVGFFCDNVAKDCIHCRVCDHTIGDTMCNATSDAICGPCIPGYYHEKDKPDLCHPCSFLSDPARGREPQCQYLRVSTELSDDPSSTTATPQETSMVVGSDALDHTTPKVDEKDSEALVTSVDGTVGQSHPEDATDETNEGIFESEGSNNDEERKDADDPFFTSTSSRLTLVICFVILGLLLVFIGCGLVYIKKHAGIFAHRQRQQRQVNREYVQARLDDDEERQNPGRRESGVSLNVMSETAHYWNRATGLWNREYAGQIHSHSGLNRGLSTSGNSLSSTIPFNYSFESAASVAGSSTTTLLDRKPGIPYIWRKEDTMLNRDSLSKNGTSASLADFSLYTEDDMVYSNSINSLKLPMHGTYLRTMQDADRPLSLRSTSETDSLLGSALNVKSLEGKRGYNRQATQSTELASNMDASCKSTEGLAMQDNESSSEGAIEQQAEGIEKPVEPEATICKPQETQTDGVSAVCAAASFPAAGAVGPSKKTADGTGKPETTLAVPLETQTETQLLSSLAAGAAAGDAARSATSFSAANAVGHSKKTADRTCKPAEPEATLFVPQETQTEPQFLAAAAAGFAAAGFPAVGFPAAGVVGHSEKNTDGIEKPVELEAMLCVPQETQTEPLPSVAAGASCAGPAAPLLNQDTRKNVTVIKDGPHSCKGNITIRGNRNKVYVMQGSRINGSFCSSDTDTESE